MHCDNDSPQLLALAKDIIIHNRLFCNRYNYAYLPLRKRLPRYSGGHFEPSRRQRGNDDQCRSRRCRHALCQLAPTVPPTTVCRTAANSRTTVPSTALSTRRSRRCTVRSVPEDRRTDRNIPSRDSFYLYARANRHRFIKQINSTREHHRRVLITRAPLI